MVALPLFAFEALLLLVLDMPTFGNLEPVIAPLFLLEVELPIRISLEV